MHCALECSQIVFTKTGLTLNLWRSWVPQTWNGPPSKSWAALRMGRLVFQLQSLACSCTSSIPQLRTPFQDGVRLQYINALLSHEPNDHWQALGWICVDHTVCIISHLHTYDSIWIEILYHQFNNLQISLVLTHLNQISLYSDCFPFCSN